MFCDPFLLPPLLADDELAARHGRLRGRCTERRRMAGHPMSMLMSQQEVNARMKRWGDVEIRRFHARMQIFQRRHVQNAAAVADRLALRDFDKDDRRMCCECKHARPMGKCAAPGVYPIADHLLFRCFEFKWERP